MNAEESYVPKFASVEEDTHSSSITNSDDGPKYPIVDAPSIGNSEESLEDEDEFGEKIDHTIPNGGWMAWIQVLSSWCLIVATFGVSSSTGTLRAYLVQTRLKDVSSSSQGWLWSVQLFLMYFGGIQVGPLFDAEGLLWLLVPGCVGWSAAILIMSWCKKYYEFMLCYAILGGLSSMLIFNPSVSVLTHWFSTHRALAIGIAASGSGVGSILFPQMLQKMLDLHGYGWAVRTMAFIVMFLCGVGVLGLRSRHRKKSINWKDARPDFPALMEKDFLFCVAGLFAVEWGIFIPMQFLVSYAEAQGFSAQYGNDLISYLSAASTVSRVITGLLADKLGNFNIMVIGAFMAGLMCLTVWLPVGHHRAALTTFSVMFGIFSGSVVALTLTVVPVLSKPKNVGRRYGTAYLIASFAVLTGIPIAGAFNHYTGVIIFTGCVYLGGSLLFLISRLFAVGLQPIF